MIQVNNVSRSYDVPKKISPTGKINAVDNISFSVNAGEIFGLLGPNGAGKSTTIKMMTTILLPTNGAISIMGFDSYKDRKKIRSNINVVFGGERGMYWKLSGYENLLYFSLLHQIPKRRAMVRIDQLMEEFELTDFKDLPVGKYSSGMKQKLHFARALLNDPKIIFLDEPTNAMDPKTSEKVRNIIFDLKNQGKTVILATHNMLEADRLCDRLLIMNKGKIIQEGKPKVLKHFLKNEKVRLQLKGVWNYEDFRVLGSDFKEIQVKQEDGATTIEILGAGINLNRIVQAVINLNAEIISVAEAIPELEEVYIKSISMEAK